MCVFKLVFTLEPVFELHFHNSFVSEGGSRQTHPKVCCSFYGVSQELAPAVAAGPSRPDRMHQAGMLPVALKEVV